MKEKEYKRIDREYYFGLKNGPEKLTVGEMPAVWAEKYGGKTAVVSGGERVSYEKLSEKVNALSSGFIKLGIRKGDHVVMQLPNTLSFVYALFALERIGAYPVLALPAHREADLSGIFNSVEPAAYIVPESYLGYRYEDMARRMKENNPSLKYIICDGKMNGAEELERLSDDTGEPPEFEKPGYRDIAHITLSGGTTGTPKLIPRENAEYLYNARKCAEVCRVTPDDVLLMVIPIAHNFSLTSFGLFGALQRGAEVVLCPYPSVDEMLPLIEDEKVTVLQLVPALVSALLETLSWDDSFDISSLRLLIVGGAVFDRELALRAEPALHCKLVQVFGTAEGINCMTSLDDPYEISASCQGKPVSEFDEIRIVDGDLNDLPQGEPGELIERGPYTIHGYYKAPEEVNRAAFTPSGFYRTGDRAKIDENGNLVVMGRIKEQFNKGGEKIMPSEIEEHLNQADFIKDSSVVGIPDDMIGTRICAFIKSDADADLGQVRNYLKKQGLPAYKLPDNVFVLQEFPLTKIGKVDKNALEKMAAKETGRVNDR